MHKAMLMVGMGILLPLLSWMVGYSRLQKWWMLRIFPESSIETFQPWEGKDFLWVELPDGMAFAAGKLPPGRWIRHRLPEGTDVVADRQMNPAVRLPDGTLIPVQSEVAQYKIVPMTDGTLFADCRNLEEPDFLAVVANRHMNPADFEAAYRIDPSLISSPRKPSVRWIIPSTGAQSMEDRKVPWPRFMIITIVTVLAMGMLHRWIDYTRIKEWRMTQLQEARKVNILRWSDDGSEVIWYQMFDGSNVVIDSDRNAVVWNRDGEMFKIDRLGIRRDYPEVPDLIMLEGDLNKALLVKFPDGTMLVAHRNRYPQTAG